MIHTAVLLSRLSDEAIISCCVIPNVIQMTITASSESVEHMRRHTAAKAKQNDTCRTKQTSRVALRPLQLMSRHPYAYTTTIMYPYLTFDDLNSDQHYAKHIDRFQHQALFGKNHGNSSGCSSQGWHRPRRFGPGNLYSFALEESDLGGLCLPNANADDHANGHCVSHLACPARPQRDEPCHQVP